MCAKRNQLSVEIILKEEIDAAIPGRTKKTRVPKKLTLCSLKQP